MMSLLARYLNPARSSRPIHRRPLVLILPPSSPTQPLLHNVVRLRRCSQRAAPLSTGNPPNRHPPPWEGPNLINQPHADQGLLTTEPPSADNIADDAAKVNIVAPDFKQHPATTTSIQDIPADLPTPGAPSGGRKSKGRRYLDEAEQEGFYLWNVAKYYILQPSVAGGLVGLGMSSAFLLRVA